MADRDEILAYAAELLELDSFSDYGPQGMQVVGAAEVKKVACGVSSSLALFQRAVELGAEMVIVHHGLFWDSEPRTIDTRMRGRLRALFYADLTLAAYHLALDAHPVVGNNAQLARLFGVSPKRPFAKIGLGGTLPRPVPPETFVALVRDKLRREPLAFPHGPDTVQRVAILSGGGGKYIAEAAAEGYDLFLTGEAEEPSLHMARELGIHFVAAGHYATERLGVQALTRRLAEKFELEWEFVELGNPV